jgi:hypothetical protein
MALEETIFDNQNYYNVAFDALAKIRLPDFSDFDDERVWEAFNGLFDAYSQERLETLAYMSKEIDQRSEGTVSLKPAEFYTGIKGPNVQFELIKGDVTKKLYFGPYVPPFGFQRE